MDQGLGSGHKDDNKRTHVFNKVYKVYHTTWHANIIYLSNCDYQFVRVFNIFLCVLIIKT